MGPGCVSDKALGTIEARTVIQLVIGYRFIGSGHR
jgi:hypothetical protein